ncbi:MAG: methylmalonyl-CoA/ethylmalonyl-CoA epimerase [Chloroflexota bacterium]|jgi:catechol 2,3-dioxygenase-like lactoylglutathione lyase family enzyme|nr:methylmalonyl-CoA/ethylmalonyl-CoA epimerase [Chloroflexota bacterium]
MPKLRHIALSTKDPEAVAEFYKRVFEMKEVGRTNTELAQGIYLSDGTINMAVLNFKTDQLNRGMDYVGLHHIGFVVEDLEEVGERLKENGAELMQPRPTTPTQFFEVKHRGPDGVVVDTSEHPWLGAAGLE